VYVCFFFLFCCFVVYAVVVYPGVIYGVGGIMCIGVVVVCSVVIMYVGVVIDGIGGVAVAATGVVTGVADNDVVVVGVVAAISHHVWCWYRLFCLR